MIRRGALLGCLMLGGCHVIPMAGLMLGLTVADKALGVTDGVVGLIRSAPAVAAPRAVGAAQIVPLPNAVEGGSRIVPLPNAPEGSARFVPATEALNGGRE